MRRAILVVVAAAVCATTVTLGWQSPAQGPPGGGRGGRGSATPASGTGMIVGTVIDAATSMPVPGAVVVLGGRGTEQVPPVVVGGDGRFVFRDLPAGAFTLPVSRNGYLDSGAGRTAITGPMRPVELRDGERRTDVVLRLWRHAVVTGTVVDEKGEPTAGLQVMLFQRAVVNGQWGLQERGTTRSDDRGSYRFAKVAPGRYVVAVQQDLDSFAESAMMAMAADLPSIMNVLAGALAGGMQLPDVDFRARVIPMTFAPGVTAADEALTLTLSSGEERAGVTVRAARVPTYRVSGTVLGPEPMPPNLSVQLTSPAHQDQPVGANLGEAGRGGSGRFDFVALPPGRYVLRAVAVPRPQGSRGRGGQGPPPAPDAPTWWAMQPVTISDRDETGISLVLREGVRITGRVQFEGAAAVMATDRFTVTATSVDGAAGWRTNTPTGVLADGTFRTVGLPPGRYVLRLAGTNAPWRVKAIRVASRDLTDLPIEVEGDDLADVVIALTDQPAATLSGTVRSTSGAGDTGTAVYVFPVDRQFWTNVGPAAQRFRTARAGEGGTYNVAGLPEGDYYVIAGSDDRLTDWMQPPVLEQFAALASRAQLRDAEQRTMDLTRSVR